MSVERTFRCDGPDCDVWWRESLTCTGLLTVTETPDDGPPLHFHSWECAIRFGARLPLRETVEAGR